MLIYNMTTKVLHAQKERWLRWMKEEAIPEMMKTGLFSDYRFCRLLDHDDEDGATYVAQYHCDSFENYDTFVKEHDERFRLWANEQFGNTYISFKTVMELL